MYSNNKKKSYFAEHPPHGKGPSSKLSDNRQAANIYKTLVPNKVCMIWEIS
jgi:hypothetical protein